MHNRLLSLINRGYSMDDVVNLSTFTQDELDKAVEVAFSYITRNCFIDDNKMAIYIGGQPGCGKTVLSMNLKNKMKNVVEIGIDNYRMYHPRYLEMEKCIRKHWNNREENINDTPGNDIADFTHVFAGAMTDKLIEKCSLLGYNLIIEWGMREPTGPLNTMKELKGIGYDNLVMFVSTNKDLSYHACELRADVMKDSMRIIRKVPKDFHDHCVDTLPDSINYIYKEGYKSNVIDYMSLVTRDGKILWDDKSMEKPGVVYENYLNGNLDVHKFRNDPAISLENNKKELGLVFSNDDVYSKDNFIFSILVPKLDIVKKCR